LIAARGLTKDYGDKRAVDGMTFTVQPGVVTGFLGPNGSGKSTTMRLILGLDAPTAGDVTVNGKHYRDHAGPLHEVGALLEARSSTPGAPRSTICSRSRRRMESPAVASRT
jgi:ABC-2 type transport system ATP-binding protein